MKKFLTATLFVLSFSAFAQETVCYRSTEIVPSIVPSVFCLEKIDQRYSEKYIYVDSKDRSVPFMIPLTKFSRHNEDKINFTAEYVYSDLEDRSWVCGSALGVRLQISGMMVIGDIDPAYLDVSVEVQETNDFCHNYPGTRVINYELVR